MKKSILLAVFMLSALIWAGAQRPNGMPAQSGSQAGPPSSQMPNSQMPNAGQSQTQTPSAPDQTASPATPQAGGSAANGPVTEGCLGGTNPNFTLTDSTGKTYKLTLPAGADGSRLTPHVGESVQVMGDISGSNTISVTKVGRGSGNCPSK